MITNFLRDAFRHGVFHADLHPANLLILPKSVVGYVDFGIVASLSPEARRKQIELTLAYASGDSESIYREFMNISKPSPDADFETIRERIGMLCLRGLVSRTHDRGKYSLSGNRDHRDDGSALDLPRLRGAGGSGDDQVHPLNDSGGRAGIADCSGARSRGFPAYGGGGVSDRRGAAENYVARGRSCNADRSGDLDEDGAHRNAALA